MPQEIVKLSIKNSRLFTFLFYIISTIPSIFSFRVPFTFASHSFTRTSSPAICNTVFQFVRHATTIASKDTDGDQMSTSYSSLKNQLAQHLLQYNTHFAFGKKEERNPLFKATIAIAGGGSSALSAITSTPNASSFLLEGIITYDRLSFANFITSASSSTKEVLVSSNQFKFSSPEAAYHLAHASLQKSLRYTHSAVEASETMNDDDLHQQLDHCIGVGCASMLSSTPGRRKSKRDPHGHVCIMFADGTTFSLFVNMNLDGLINSNYDSLMIRRDQDDLLSCVVLLSILISMRDKIAKSKMISLDDDSIQSTLTQLNNIIYNYITELTSSKGETTKAAPTMRVTFEPNPQKLLESSNDSMIQINNIVKTRAKQIIQQDLNAAILLLKQKQYPTMNTNHEIEKNHPITGSFTSYQEPMIPMDSIIFPGSFNPMHKGHITLAYNAMKIIFEKRKEEYRERSHHRNTSNQSEEDMISIWDVAVSSNSLEKEIKYPVVFFEMSITNADKAPMDIDQVEKRTSWIIEEMSKYNDAEDSINVPQWGVLLDSAPLFIQKVKLVESLLVRSSHSDLASDETNKRKMTFVIGTDTLVRLLDIKYYENNVENMLTAMRDMKNKGVHFVVGGRSQQGVESKTPKFIDGSDEVASQPSDIQEMFTLLQEKDFRVDMSSTEIRKERSLK